MGIRDLGLRNMAVKLVEGSSLENKACIIFIEKEDQTFDIIKNIKDEDVYMITDSFKESSPNKEG